MISQFTAILLALLFCEVISLLPFKQIVFTPKEFELLENLQSKLNNNGLSEISRYSMQGISNTLNSLDSLHFKEFLDGNNVIVSLWSYLEVLSNNPSFVPLFFFITFITTLSTLDDSNTSNPYTDDTIAVFDSVKQSNYYARRPFYVLKRMLSLSSSSFTFGLKLLIDWKSNKLEENESIRAKELLDLIPKLGPTMLKLGQALSIRTDILPEKYALELRKLQDSCPQFDNNIAKEIIRKELNISDLNDYFSEFSEKPVACASIGQVYKGRIKSSNQMVAIKVQRPEVLNDISLDLYIMSILSPIQVKIQNAVNKRATSSADIEVALSLVKEWSRGFINEINYMKEAKNQELFINAMISRNLTAVTAPKVFLASNKIILTQWIDGTKLDIDKSEDTARLCSIAINAYLTMLLDTATLHADAHTGNLLRGNSDGKLYILDWGMTLDIPKDLQYSLLEFIAHINSEDYEALPQDFVNLGFSPKDKLDKVKSSGLTEGLSFILRQLNKGGGPKKIGERVKEEFKAKYGENLSDDELRVKAREEMVSKMQEQLKKEGVNVNGVTATIEEMSRRNRELFKLPSWILYTSRAFSTLEGIGLKLDEDFSILQSCYPYLAARLFSDNSHRSKEALKSMLYSGNNNILSVDKYFEMQTNFNKYTTSIVNKDLAEDALMNLLLNDDSAIQEILVESSASLTDSLLIELYNVVSKSDGVKFFKNSLQMQKNIIDNIAPNPIRNILAMPIIVSQNLISGADILFSKTENDDTKISTIKTLVNSFQSSNSSVTSQRNILQTINSIDPSLLRQVLQKSPILARKFISALSKNTAQRLLDRSDQNTDENVKTLAKLGSNGLLLLSNTVKS